MRVIIICLLAFLGPVTLNASSGRSYTLANKNSSAFEYVLSSPFVVGSSESQIPTITVQGTNTIACNSGSITLISSSQNNNQWNKDGVAISGATSQYYTASISGVYTVTSTNSGITSTGTTITIVPYINVSSIQSNTGNVCTGSSITLTNATVGGVWSSNDTASATVNSNGVVTGISVGSVNITYTVTTSGCSNASSYTLNVVDGSNITAPIIAAQSSTSLCGNGTVQICPTVWGWSNYQWYNNGVAVTQNGTGACITVDTSKLGSFTLAATTGSGCWSAQSNAITVTTAAAPATPTISAGGSTNICSGGSVTLTSSSSTDNQWQKDGVSINGATSQTYNATDSGVYTVAVAVCGGTTSAGTTVTVVSPITVAAIAGINSICLGSTGTLTNATLGGVWTSSDSLIASIDASGIVTPVSAGTVTISYTVTVGSCSNTVTYGITVPSQGIPVAPIIAAQSSTSLCGNGTVQICPTVWGWSNYQWYNNGVAVTQNGTGACIVIDTAKLGSYTLSVTTGTCWSAQSNAIAVTTAAAPATPTISAGSSTNICSGGSVTLTSSSSTDNQWQKDGVSINGATSQTYAATASGVYTVTTTVCGSITSAGTTVTVSAPITITPIAGNNSVCVGSSTTLSNATAGGVWSSSNTAVATISNTGVVTTVSAGTTVISYTVTAGSCSNAATYTLTVPAGSVTTPSLDIRGSVNICGSNSLQICPLVWGYSNFQWYKDGVPYSTSACITVNTAGAYTLTGTNGSGCWSSPSAPANVTINALPTVAATTGATSVCAGSTITLSNSSTIPSGGTGVWSTPSTSTATVNAASGVVRGNASGTATIVYTVTSAVGCSSTASYAVTVRAIPSVPNIAYAPGTSDPQYGAPAGSFCANKTFTVVGNPTGGVWSKTGVISVTTPGGVVTTGSVAGTGSLTYTYTDANGCSNSRTISGNVAICAGPRGVNASSNDQLAGSSEFTMYPNPARSFISLSIKTLIGAGNIVVTDLYGKQVKQQPLSMGNNTVDVAHLAKGFYLVSIITEQGKTTKKLIVE